jgi:hypothetical protein
MKLNQTKISFIIFAILCIFSLAFFSWADENSSSGKNIFLDSDQDGLSDDEEITYGTNPSSRDSDGDGYSDGAEVKSGYDPLKPAPGDKIIKTQKIAIEKIENSEDKNLTTEISNELASLITERAAEKKTITTDDLDSMIENVAGPTLSYEDLPEVDTSEIKIKKQNYSDLSKDGREEKEKKDAEEYLVAVSYVIVNYLPEKIENTSDLENMASTLVARIQGLSSDISDVSYFENLAKKSEESLEQLKEIEVPENMIDIHTKGIQLMKYSITLKDTAKPDPADPIKSIANLSKVKSVIVLSSDLYSEVNSRFESLGITEIPLEL